MRKTYSLKYPKLYNGGGHKKAAGASVAKPIDEVAAELLPAIEALILAL